MAYNLQSELNVMWHHVGSDVIRPELVKTSKDKETPFDFSDDFLVGKFTGETLD